MPMCKPTFQSCLHPPAGIEMLSDLWTGAGTETSIDVLVIKVRVTVMVDVLNDAVVEASTGGTVGNAIDMLLYTENLEEIVVEPIVLVGAVTAIIVSIGVGIGAVVDICMETLINMLAGKITG